MKENKREIRRPHDIKLQLPKDPLKYKAKRLYWLLLEIELQMKDDLESVDTKKYLSILDAYIEVCEDLKAKGITYGTKTKQRMEREAAQASAAERGGSQGVSEDGQAGLGARVSADNPIT